MTQLPVMRQARPFFLDIEPGQRFCLYHPPAGDCRGAILYVHPFGEEMNKTRRMAALQARALSALGYGVLQIDLHGCGDSSGDFGDARWEQWLRDVSAGCDWLQRELGQPVSLWGCRLGAMLALEHARQAGPGAVERVVLWQAVPSGALYLTQFLRLRVASEMMGDKKTGGTDVLRAALRAGKVLEIAGYELAPALADAIEARDATSLAVMACPVYWLELVSATERPLSPASVRVTDAWRQAGTQIHRQAVAGQAFWATQEITECTALIDATCAVFGGPRT